MEFHDILYKARDFDCINFEELVKRKRISVEFWCLCVCVCGVGYKTRPHMHDYVQIETLIRNT